MGRGSGGFRGAAGRTLGDGARSAAERSDAAGDVKAMESMTTREGDGRTITVVEESRIPLDGLLLGLGAVLPFPLALAVLWLAEPATGRVAVDAISAYGAAILVFLGGVRRGLSFRTPGGPRPGQIGMALWLFAAGLVALVLPVAAALGVLLAAYASVFILDPVAARRGEAPLYFARLRPGQLAIPVAALVLMLLSF
jgi:hypothetical protein